MSKNEGKEATSKGPEFSRPDFAKIKADARAFFSKLSVYDFIDVTRPWVLVDNGSFMGFFDFVPPVFRQGSWALLPMMYITSVVYVVLFGAVQKYATEGLHFQDIARDFYPAYSVPWFCNLAGSLWTCYVFRDLFLNGPGLAAITTFTIQSYGYLSLRFLLSTLAPFFPFLAPYNELMRYAVLSQATVTFVVWNFVLAPTIYLSIQDPEKRKGFVQYMTGFRLTQLHFFNIFLATFNGVYGTPARTFIWTDLYTALLLGMQYCLFYVFILDRLGLHFYMIFSPRTNVALVSWTMVIASTVGLYSFWGNLIEKHGDYWDHVSWAI